ncbi:MAG: hypothetical protein ABH870_02130 [bacterium]
MMYRPPNWDVVKPIPYEPKDGESAWGFYEHGVEAGADAMLESLQGMGMVLEDSEQLIYALKVPNEDIDDFRYHAHINGFYKMQIKGRGTLVFIPDA